MIINKKALLLLAVASVANAGQSVDGQAATLYATDIVSSFAKVQKEGATPAQNYQAMLATFADPSFDHNWNECSDKARRAGKKGCGEIINSISKDPLVQAATVQAEIKFDGAEKTTKDLLEEKQRLAVFVCANALRDAVEDLNTKFSNAQKYKHVTELKVKEEERKTALTKDLSSVKVGNLRVAAEGKELSQEDKEFNRAVEEAKVKKANLENEINKSDASISSYNTTLENLAKNKLTDADHKKMSEARRTFLQEQLKGNYASTVANEAINFNNDKLSLLNRITSVVTDRRNKATKDGSEAAAELEYLANSLVDLLASKK